MREIFLQCFAILILLGFITPTDLSGRTNTLDESYLTLFTDTLLNLEDTVRFDLDDCSFTAEVCIGVPIDSISDYQITVNGAAYTNGIAGCDFDTSNIYSYANFYLQGNGGPYILQEWDVSGSIFSSPFNTMQELVDSMNAWDPIGNWILDTDNLLISGGAPGNTYSDMEVWVLAIGSTNIIGHNDNFIPQGTLLFIGSGATELIITESSTGAQDTALIVASCAQPDTIMEMTIVGQAGTTCLDLSELTSDLESVTNISNPNVIVDYQLVNNDSCIQFTGLAIGTDTTCFSACDVLGVCDTTCLIVNVLPALGTTELFDTLFIGQATQWCADTSMFLGNVDTIYNICPGSSGTYVNYTIDEDNYCVSYNGIDGLGTEQGCFVVCDDLNNCDTTILTITVRDMGPDFYYDTLYLNEEGFFCDWDTTNLFGDLVNIENGCPSSSGSSVFFDLDVTNFCISYDAIGVGKDTACIYLTDDTGAMDTTYAIVCVLQPDPELVIDTIRLSINPVYCMDTTQLAGTITSIENICPDDSGEAIEFVIDSMTFCVQANPIELGTDSACIVICDEFGVCDTTNLIVTVEEEDIMMTPPIANDDIDSTDQNASIIIDVCLNDSVPDGTMVTNFFVLPVASGGIGPNNGTAFSNADCTVSYTPNDDFCGEDQITYVICNNMGCDTASVNISVICPDGEFKIFSGFSPNGDGVNEFFKINGINQFPNHTLYVYNRWGNQVLKVSNYQNDWNGTWEGSDLPDGTYFYVFDTGEGDTRTGYVYLGR